MLIKTPGIVLSSIKYQDSSLIVKILTRELGVQSYIVNGVRSKKAQGKAALFQPLTVLDMVVYFAENKSIHRISDVKLKKPLLSIQQNFQKTAIAMFLSEVIYKSLKNESDPNHDLFDFVEHSIFKLEEDDDDFENLHISFLHHYIQYLGFESSDANDMNDMIRQSSQQSAVYFDEEHNWNAPVSGRKRQEYLSSWLSYYQAVLPGFGPIKSLEILKEVFSA